MGARCGLGCAVGVRKTFLNRAVPCWVLLAHSALLPSGCGTWACLPCVMGHDPRDTAIASVEQWAARADKSDPCRINAMEHCVAAALLAGDCGDQCAIWAGEVLEALQRDGDPMDTHNNRRGAQCEAAEAAEDDDGMDDGGLGPDAAIDCCTAMLENGDLRTNGRCR